MSGAERAVARVRCSCGRWFLEVCGFALAVEGDPCRDVGLPESVLPPIPASELAAASIGGRPAAELPLAVVRFFRGERWTEASLRWVAAEVNRRADLRPAGGGAPLKESD